MAENPTPHLSSDRPIGSLREDKLTRGSFAVALANALTTWKGNDSLVVALYGPWGSGKTSVKNMVLELVGRADPRPAVVEFNPWEWSGRDRLQGAFLNEIGIAIQSKATGVDSKALAEKWRRYAARLSLGGTVVGYLQTATGVIGVPLAPALLGAAAAVFDKTADMSAKAAAAHDAGQDGESLESLKRDLATSLGKMTTPILVVMDDVDRLTEEEIRSLFQLIKANADFPKTVYLLLFDRAVVEKALDGVTGSSGREYMEKIVQVGFDIPKAGQGAIERVLFEGLNRVLSPSGMDKTFTQDHWGNVYTNGLRPFFETLRDVNRFLSSLSFGALVFYRNGTMEVNVVDLIAVETLRVFEPDVYHALPQYRNLLVGRETAYHLHGQDAIKERKRQLEALLKTASESRLDVVRELLGQLFPNVGTLLNNHGRLVGFEAGWLRHLRICHDSLFDRYFQWDIPEGDVPMSLINGLLDATADREAIRALLAPMCEGGRLLGVLGRLSAFTERLDRTRRTNLITAIYDVGDTLADSDGRSLFDLPADFRTTASIYWLLLQEQDASVRGLILNEALVNTDGVILPTGQVSGESGRHEESDGRTTERLLDAEGLGRAKRICAAKVEAAARSGRTFGRKLSAVLWCWKEWGNVDAARTYAAELASSPSGALALLDGFLNETRISAVGSYTTQSRWTISLKGVEQYVDLTRLQDVLAPLLGASVPPGLATLAQEYDLVICTFREALERRAKGQPEESGEDR